MVLARFVQHRILCGLIAGAIGLGILVPAPASAEESTLVARYAQAVGSANAALSPAMQRELAQRLLLLSSYYQIDPRLLLAIVSAESSWRAGATSPVGALGFGQLMPATAASLKVQALEPYENLDGTARYLRRMVVRFATLPPIERIRRAVASYNAGPYAVARYGGVPPYRETQNYVATVLASWRHFSAQLDDPTASAVNRLATDRALRLTRPTPAIRTTHVAMIARSERPISRRSALPKRTAIAGDPAHFQSLEVIAEAPTPAPPVRYEASHSFIARLFGMKHRVVETAP